MCPDQGLGRQPDPLQVPGGIWLRGCYLVLKKGTGYGADPLDLELRSAGSVCPS